jgi:hypothetical protein
MGDWWERVARNLILAIALPNREVQLISSFSKKALENFLELFWGVVLLNPGMNFSESAERGAALSLKFMLQISNALFSGCY